VAEIVPGVGEQRQGIRKQAVEDLCNHQREVERNGDAEVAAVVIGRLATPLLVMTMAVTLRHHCCSAFAAKLAAAAMNTRTWRGAPSRPFRRRRVETALLQQRIDRRQPPAEGL